MEFNYLEGHNKRDGLMSISRKKYTSPFINKIKQFRRHVYCILLSIPFLKSDFHSIKCCFTRFGDDNAVTILLT